MTIPDRILLFFYACVVAILSAFVLVQALGFNIVPVLPVLNDQVLMLILALMLFLISLRFIFLRSRQKGEREPEAILRTTEIGDVRISLLTLESLATRAARGFRGVHELQTKVRFTETGVRILLKMACDPDLDIPALTEALQSKVKQYVEETTGAHVEEVRVFVKDLFKRKGLSGTRSSRVE